MPKMEKKGSGRRKIEMKKIDNLRARRVCFSKRRTGLFKKASELCRLCDVQIAIVVFSPAGRVHTFGDPSVDSLIDRYLRSSSSTQSGGGPEVDQMGLTSRRHCADLVEEIETAKRRKVVLQPETTATAASGFWWEADIAGLGLRDLVEYKTSLEKLRDNVSNRADELQKANLAWLEEFLLESD